jgi:ribosome biogenesis GTPase / thiamine phosphate phosphatase
MRSRKEGLVFKSTGSWYKVRFDNNNFLECRVRGKLKLSQLKTTNPVAVGDKVMVIPDAQHPGTGIIEDILPRTNFVIRKSVHKTEHGHLLAANIDQAALMVTINHPRTSYGFIDRFLVSTDAYRIPSVLLINKTDLHKSKENDLMLEMCTTYEPIGVKCYPISVKTNTGLGFLTDFLQDKISLFAGHSGTGKSTLMNYLHPEINQKIGEVSAFANKGIHTTTFAEMFKIKQNTLVIDTPGINELGLIDIGDHELSDYFPEMRALLGKCKFNNCSHTHEPDCAVLNQVEAGKITISRYRSYLSMLENIDTRR